MLQRMMISLLLLGSWLGTGWSREPLVEKYLLEGKLSAGEQALQKYLAKETTDDQARFGLGVVQFLRSFERLGASLNKYGLRTERAFARQFEQPRTLVPQNPRPETLTYAAAREIVQTWVQDLNRAEASLAGIKDDKVKLPLHVGRINIDPLDQGKPISAAVLLGRLDAGVPSSRSKRS